MTRPILWSFRRCPYAMRARLAIASAGIQCELREVVLRDKPAEFLKTSPKATVPVLVVPDGAVVEESRDIMMWALRARDPEGWLEQEPALRHWVDEAETGFKDALDRYKYASRFGDVDPGEERDRALDFLRRIDAALSAEGWLSGTRAGFADYAILPFVRQFAFVDKPWFDAQSISGVQAWLDRFLTSDRFTAVMTKYPRWTNGDAVTLFP